MLAEAVRRSTVTRAAGFQPAVRDLRRSILSSSSIPLGAPVSDPARPFFGVRGLGTAFTRRALARRLLPRTARLCLAGPSLSTRPLRSPYNARFQRAGYAASLLRPSERRASARPVYPLSMLDVS